MLKENQQNFWPVLEYEQWEETLNTLHMWMQIVGKIKLELNPFINQWWEVAFYLTARGLTSGIIHYQGNAFEMKFDFFVHKLFIETSDGNRDAISLKNKCVKDFYKEVGASLKSLGINYKLWPVPVEVTNPIPFAQDSTNCKYDKKHAFAWWQAQLKIFLIFEKFRSTFRGKISPVQFYWGSFDLNCTFFSGKKVDSPKAEGSMRRIMEFAENEENFALGFWPGDNRYPHAAFYSYIYPAPKGLNMLKINPRYASFDKTLSEFVLPYDEVVQHENPEKEIMNFLQVTFRKCAELSGWNWKEFKTKKPF